MKWTLLGIVCVLGQLASSASAAYMVPWSEEDDAYFLRVPASTSLSPDVSQGDEISYVNYSATGSFWIVDTQEQDDAVWSFELADGSAIDSVTIAVRTYINPGVAGAEGSYSKSYFGADPLAVDTPIGEQVSPSSGFVVYDETFTDVNSNTIYFRHEMNNNTQTPGAVRLQVFTITATAVPEPGALGVMSLSCLGLLIRRRPSHAVE